MFIKNLTRKISYQSRNPRNEMWLKVLFKQNISMVWLSRIWQGDVRDFNISSHYNINDHFSSHACCLIIDIIMCKDQRKNLQLIDSKC